MFLFRILLLILIVASSVQAQDRQIEDEHLNPKPAGMVNFRPDGSMVAKGRVVNMIDGKPVSGATIGNNFHRNPVGKSVSADSLGAFEIMLYLEKNEHQLKVEKPGFKAEYFKFTPTNYNNLLIQLIPETDVPKVWSQSVRHAHDSYDNRRTCLEYLRHYPSPEKLEETGFRPLKRIFKSKKASAEN